MLLRSHSCFWGKQKPRGVAKTGGQCLGSKRQYYRQEFRQVRWVGFPL